MATDAQALRACDALERQDERQAIPSPAKVQATAAEIRESWTPRQRRRRAQLARSMLRQQLLAPSPVDEPRRGRPGLPAYTQVPAFALVTTASMTRMLATESSRGVGTSRSSSTA